MTNIELDDSTIGPLYRSRIGDAPISWGTERDFSTADPQTGQYVERQLERYRPHAVEVAEDEIRILLHDLQANSEPTGVLHGVATWGPVSVPRLSGYLSRTVNDVEDRLKALEFLNLVRVADELELGDLTFEIEPQARFFERATSQSPATHGGEATSRLAVR